MSNQADPHRETEPLPELHRADSPPAQPYAQAQDFTPTQPYEQLQPYTQTQQYAHAQQYAQAPEASFAPPAQYTPQPTVPTTLAYTNTYALVSILTAFLVPIAAIIFGHMALGQIKQNGDAGRGLALTGLIIGYSYFVFIALFVIFYLSVIGLMLTSMGTLMSGSSDFSSF